MPASRQPLRIAILGWGSLVWAKRPVFDDLHEAWRDDGPILPLEFSHVSASLCGALSLVIDPENGQPCQVQYAVSKRTSAGDVIGDLRLREQIHYPAVGFYFADGSRTCDPIVPAAIPPWVHDKGFDVAVWTGLASDFAWEREMHGYEEAQSRFTVENALDHTLYLFPKGLAMAREYVWRAQAYIDTPVRRALQAAPWFQPPEPDDTSAV